MEVRSFHDELFPLSPLLLTHLNVGTLAVAPIPAPATGYVIPLTRTDFAAASCPSETPISELNRYTNDINGLHSSVAAAINAIPAGGLVMGSFARATNALASYVNAMPREFCIGPGNRSAFEQMQNSLNAAVNSVRRGNSIFEQNSEAYSNRITPLLQRLQNESNAITPSSRDFTGVMDAFAMYDNIAKQYQLEIWNLTPRIEGIFNQLNQLATATDTSLKRAINQIEANVEGEAQRFVGEERLAEDAFRHWDGVDGKQGYEKYMAILRNVVRVMVPAFNEFLRRVPGTNRVRAAVQTAQQAINQMDTGFASFPNFSVLTSDSATFPHNRYGNEDRKFGGAKVLSALASIATAYYSRTSEKIYIGDMQYEHGGKMGIHKSHKEGIDADVDGTSIGDVPNHNAALALALAKEILSAGAKLVFYADQTTVTEANRWAATNSITGRLQVEANHTKHFHLRMPW
jgi:Penicillin-insensitive murein endopeptidase